MLLNIKIIELGGEPLKKEIIERMSEIYKGEIYNTYGSTEIVINSKKIYRDEEILRLYPGIKVWIEDEDRKEVKQGEKGTICISSKKLASGYFKQEEETKKRYRKDKDKLVFKTGDYGRINEKGELEVLGRVDRMVKINGIRVELVNLIESY